GALKVILTAKLQDSELLVLDALDMPEIKTKRFVQAMNGLGLKNALIVTAEADEELEKSSRNVPGFKILRAAGLNVYDIVKYERLVLLQPSLAKIEERLLK
ncbi:MAG: uL4 family ribosomal protein, partial [Thermodesulfobacteriota bacterium]|nr:uL4 family ribosomal protein [Thermodesulfobacteriota bacterium]